MHDIVGGGPVVHLNRTLQESDFEVLVHFTSEPLDLIMIDVNVFLPHLFSKLFLPHDCLEEHLVLILETLHLLLV